MKKTTLVALATLFANVFQIDGAWPYTYLCKDNRCRKTLTNSSSTDPYVSMHVCKLNCDDIGSLWPKPTGQVYVGKETVAIPDSVDQIVFNVASVNGPEMTTLCNGAFKIFQDNLQKMKPSSKPASISAPLVVNSLKIDVNIETNTTSMNLNVDDEAYNLKIEKAEAGGNTVLTATINAKTYFGARHGLETLSQLIAHDEATSFHVVSNVSIADKPVFPYRAVMMDTSRNYYSVDKIKKVIDGLSYNKMSVLHWHITDSHSFPMEVTRRPKMSQYGSYSPEKIYSVAAMKDVVSYGKQRGIKVVPELDQPAHSGYGYQWGKEDGLGELVVCLDKEPWYDFCVEPPCGQLNIVNENVPEVIGDIFTNMMEVFDKDIFHMGGDEVDFRCYNSTPEVTEYMKQNNLSLDAKGFYDLWGGFQEKLRLKLLAASSTETKVIMWTSGLTDASRIQNYLDKEKYIIYIWSESTDKNIGELLKLGYKVIFANVDALYLDCGFQAWLGNGHNWCSPIKGWQTVYDNNPEKIYAGFTNDSIASGAVASGQIFGSAAPLWSEQADDKALESRIFPRAAAHAERLWSHPTTGYEDAWSRMVTNRDRMVKRGIDADRLQPEYCLQLDGMCYAESRVAPTPGDPAPTSKTPTEAPGKSSGDGLTYSVTFALLGVFLTIYL